MSKNQPQRRGRGRPRSTSLVDIPHELENRLIFAGFSDPEAVLDVAGSLPPDATEFPLHDRFRATFVRYSRKHHDWESAALALGKSWKTFQRYLNGGVIPEEVVQAIAAAARVPADWIRTGQGLPRAFPDVVNVRAASIRASAGGGSYVHESATDTVVFPRFLLTRLGLRPEYTWLLTASGLSMSPTIDDGDLMLVDTFEERRLHPRDGLIYVFTLGDNVYVKRLRRSPSGWIMKADNVALFPEEPIPAEAHFNVLGRVVWVGHKL